MSNFGFLKAEWADVFDAAQAAENTARSDPRTACIQARRGLEIAVQWVYTADRSLHVPYESSLSALIHEPTFKAAASERVFSKARVVKDLGNEAVHSSHQMRPEDGIAAVRELFHVCYWLAGTYARGQRPADAVAFDPALLPTIVVAPKTREQLVALATMVRVDCGTDAKRASDATARAGHCVAPASPANSRAKISVAAGAAPSRNGCNSPET